MRAAAFSASWEACCVGGRPCGSNTRLHRHYDGSVWSFNDTSSVKREEMPSYRLLFHATTYFLHKNAQQLRDAAAVNSDVASSRVHQLNEYSRGGQAVRHLDRGRGAQNIGLGGGCVQHGDHGQCVDPKTSNVTAETEISIHHDDQRTLAFVGPMKRPPRA